MGLWPRGRRWMGAAVTHSWNGVRNIRFFSFPMEGPHQAEQALPRGIFGMPCGVGLPAFQVIYRRLPKQRLEETKTSHLIDQQLEHFSGLAPDEAVAGLATGLHAKMHWFALTRRERVENAVQTIDEQGFRLFDVLPAGLGLFETVRSFSRIPGEVVAAVELDQGHGEFVVCSGDELLYTRGLEGLPAPRSEDGEERVLAQIEASLDLYREKSVPTLMPTRLLAFSPHAPNGFRARLRDRIGMDCVRLEFPGADQEDASPTALGLALLLKRPSSQRISLLPEETRHLVRAAGRNHYWTATAFVLLLAPLLLGLGLRLERLRIETAAAHLQKHIHQIQSQSEHLQARSGQIARLQSEMIPLARAEFSTEEAKAVLEAVALAKNPEDWVTLITDSTSYFSNLQTPPASDSAAPEGNPTTNLYVVEGYTTSPDLASVQAFITQLKMHPALVAADLLGDDLIRDLNNREVIWRDVPAIPFAVELEVRVP